MTAGEDTPRLARLERLFEQTLGQAHERRAEFLAEACPDDEALRREVLALLEADGAAAAYFEELAGAVARSAGGELASAGAAPERIGPYRVIGELGRGGMGTVYLGERADGQFERRVAVKLVRRGLETKAGLERFDRERLILARLDHPNIARLLGGGVSDEGSPYLEMELVEGVSLTRHCEQARLSVDERLRLFEAVCEAVAHAHRHLVVHRDLKPGNILVRPDGSVKLLDFGIAKLLDGDGSLASETRTAARALTPAYAAPEQLHGRAVTTATDVYALGIVLYELLTGRHPRGASGPGEAGEPEPPSRAVLRPRREGPPGDLAEAVSAPARLSRRLAGDLDAICLKALEQEPARRYGSAQKLLEDLQRHRDARPIAARPPTTAYRTLRWMRRNRAAALGLLVASLLAPAFAASMAVHAERLGRERDKASRVAELIGELVQISDPYATPGEVARAVEVLEQAAGRLERSRSERPEVRAALLDILGRSLQGLGRHARASELLEAGLREREGALGKRHPETLESLEHVRQLRLATGDQQAADALAHEICERGGACAR